MAIQHGLFAGDLDRLSPWLERVIERMPIFATVGIKRVVIGAIPRTPDGLLLGTAAGLRDFWQCCGASIGIAQGGQAAESCWAQWMVHGAADINMREFDPRRFGPWSDQDYTGTKFFDDYHHMFVTHCRVRSAWRRVRGAAHRCLNGPGMVGEINEAEYAAD